MSTVSPSIRCAGFTLIEVVVVIVMLAFAAAGITSLYFAAVRGSADPLVRKQAVAVAESMLEEIQLAAFAIGGFPGPVTQATRNQADDVRDYAGFATTGVFTVDGTAVPGLGAYNVAVSVATQALGAAPATDSLRITVTVTAPNVNVALDGYKLNYSPP